MDRHELLTLISAEYASDEIGQSIPTEITRTVFACPKSISFNEFAEAGKVGIQPQWKMEMFPHDYHNEQFAEYQGVRYSVYRTYRRNDETVELYLERRVGNGE